ncbi:MAG: hypothetical protein ACQEVA_23310 [Myxococcota bacterium]
MTDATDHEFIYQLHVPETGRSGFFTGWPKAMRIAKISRERGMKVRIYKAPLATEVTAARMAQLMTRAMEAGIEGHEPPFFATSTIMYSDFGDEGEFDGDPFKNVEIDMEIVRAEDFEGKVPPWR